MVDHRRLQRTLFLMQLDRGFAERVHAGDEVTCASLGLDTESLSWLREQELAAISADPSGKRRMQIVGNIAGEYTLSLTAQTVCTATSDWLEEFFHSPALHGAVLREDRLPLAFGAYALEDALSCGSPALAAVIEVEHALAELRRVAVGGRYGTLPASPTRPHGGDRSGTVEAVKNPSRSEDDPVWLSNRARLLEVAAGTHAWCEALQACVEDGSNTPPSAPAGFPGTERETVLLFAHRVASPHRPAEVRTELLAPLVDETLRRTRDGFTRTGRAAFARRNGAEPEELEDFLRGFLEEGVLVRR